LLRLGNVFRETGDGGAAHFALAEVTRLSECRSVPPLPRIEEVEGARSHTANWLEASRLAPFRCADVFLTTESWARRACLTSSTREGWIAGAAHCSWKGEQWALSAGLSGVFFEACATAPASVMRESGMNRPGVRNRAERPMAGARGQGTPLLFRSFSRRAAGEALAVGTLCAGCKTI